jgi:hypothetical protein
MDSVSQSLGDACHQTVATFLWTLTFASFLWTLTFVVSLWILISVAYP